MKQGVKYLLSSLNLGMMENTSTLLYLLLTVITGVKSSRKVKDFLAFLSRN